MQSAYSISQRVEGVYCEKMCQIYAIKQSESALDKLKLRLNLLILKDARNRSRTCTPLLAGDFKSPVSTIPPSERNFSFETRVYKKGELYSRKIELNIASGIKQPLAKNKELEKVRIMPTMKGGKMSRREGIDLQMLRDGRRGNPI